MDRLVRGEPRARPLIALERAQLLPYVRRYGSIRSSERGPFRLGYDTAWALAETGDRDLGAAFRDDFAATEAGTAANFQAVFSTAVLAAAVATPADVDRVEARLRARPESPVVSAEAFYLANVGDETLARRVLNDAAADPRPGGSSPLWFTLAVGARHPRIGYAYFRAHLRDFERGIPPSQQAWAIAIGAADNLWAAVPPRELESYLAGEFPADRGVVREASARIERHWAQRRSLLAALDVLGG
jgi:hypothetical protein